MSTFGDLIGRGARPNIGVGESQAPGELSKEQDLIYNQWRRGLDTSESPQDIQPDSATDLVDVEVDYTDALIRAPGITEDEDVSPRSPLYIFQQAGLDFSTELVIIDPPWLGYRDIATFTFVNLAIANTGQFGWGVADVAGTLIFSNGVNATYTRAAGAAVVTDISSEIVAQCFATAFGRVFAGAVVDSVVGLISLAVAWNAASGAIDDWTGTGSGIEELISNNLEADRVVAIIPIGLETMGILCRKSLWAGYKTGVDDRPADFQIRFVGLGCVGRDTACSTPIGIMHLSDQGVVAYDLNNAQVISAEVNALLVPLDYNQLNNYRAIFDTSDNRYILSTPFRIYIYELPEMRNDGSPNRPARWMVRSFVAQSLVMFTDQTGGVFWNTVVGPWNLQTLSWAEMAIGQANSPAIPFFTQSTLIGYQDYNATQNFDDAQDPFWVTPDVLQKVTDNIETHCFEIQYRSMADAEVSLTTTDVDGNLTLTETRVLPNTSGVRKKRLIWTHTMVGMGTSLKISFGETAICAIERVRRVVMYAGPSINSTLNG